MLKLKPLSKPEDVHLESLIPFFESYPNIAFAYIFGSYAQQVTNPLSDVDIALYLRNNQKDAIFDILNTIPIPDDRVDLTILNHASSLLKYEVVSTGKLVYCKDKSAWHNFLMHTWSIYFDMIPFRQFWRHNMKMQIENGVFV